MNCNTSFDSSKILFVKKSKLEGKVKISGAKNSALKLLTGSILTDEDVLIKNYPASLLDTRIHVGMLEKLGKNCIVEDNWIKIAKHKPLKEELLWEGQSIRNTLLIFGALLARLGRARVPLPGGCSIGDRKYDLHQMVLEKLGAKVWTEDNHLCGEAPNGLVGSEIVLPIRSTGATENAIISGSLARGKTILWGPHIRPEIIDLIKFLRSMGAIIDVYGQESIHIQGVEGLQGAEYQTMPDNMEAITFLIAAVITGGDVEIENFPYAHLEIPLIYLKESGAKLFRGPNTIIVRGKRCFPVEISTGPYPGINSDMQPLFAIFGLCARGESRIIDLRFPERFAYTEELKKMGAEISVQNNVLVIKGGKILKGTNVIALDLRCGAALILAGLVSEGTTIIGDAEQINRGYQHIEKKLQILGGKIFFDSINKKD